MSSKEHLQLQLRTTITELKDAYTELVCSELASCSVSVLVRVCKSLNAASAAVDNAWRDTFKPSLQPYTVRVSELHNPKLKSVAIIEDGWMAGFDPVILHCRRSKPRS
jgi:hypothetical protein